VFVPTDYRGIAELGLITGVGMFIIFALTLTFFPALLSSWLAVDPERLRARALPPHSGWWQYFERHPRPVRWLALAALIAAVTIIARLGTDFDANVIDMRDQTTESVQAFNDLLEDSATSPWYVNMVAPDLETAKARARQVSELELVERAITIADYVPTEQEEKLEILADVAMLMDSPAGLTPRSKQHVPPSAEEQLVALRELRDFLSSEWMEKSLSPLTRNMRLLRARLDAMLERVEEEGNAEEALTTLEHVLLSSLPDQLERMRRSLQASEITLDDLPEKLRERMLASDGSARIQVFPSQSLDDHENFESFVDAVRSLDPMTSGVVVNLVDFGRSTLSSFRQALISAGLVIAALLWLLWRRLSDMALVMAPLLLGTAITVASMVLLGISFNFANVLVLPLMFGVGVDSGIHLVHRSHLPLPAGESLMGTTTARAVFYSASTTLVSFGTLTFSSHRGMQSLGITLTIAMIATVLSNLVVLPALIDLRTRLRT
jgi:hopanoid biosynthesis associated RND transporter like protein HpnN